MIRGALGVVATAVALACAACGGGGSTVPPESSAAASSGAHGSVVYRLAGAASTWRVTTGGATADAITLRRSTGARSAPARMTLTATGLGFPAFGHGDGLAYAGPGVDADWTQQDNRYSVSVATTGSRVGLLEWSRGGTWQARVDGRLVFAQPRSAGSNEASHTLEVGLGHSAAGHRHVVTFGLANGVWVAGLQAGGAHDRVSSAPAAKGADIYWLGDSYSVGSGADHPGFDGLVQDAAAVAGADDVVVDALGGTGYVRHNAVAGFPRYVVRLRDSLGRHRLRPGWMVVAGSINDAAYPASEITAAASDVFAEVGRLSPDTRVIVVPLSAQFPVPSPIARANAAILAAARRARNVVGIDDLPRAVSRSAGTEAKLRSSGALESKRVPFHPSQAGHRLFGTQIGRFIRACEHRVSSGGAGHLVCGG